MYKAVVNKYYIDELYAALFVKPLVDGSTRDLVAWQLTRDVIDTSVNDAADSTRSCLRMLFAICSPEICARTRDGSQPAQLP